MILAPALVIFGAVIVPESRRVIHATNAASASEDSARAFPRARYEVLQRRARRFRITPPLLVAFMWVGVVALNVHGNVYYWFGAVAVGLALLAAALRAHLGLRRSANRA